MKKMAFYILFENKNTVLFLYFISFCLTNKCIRSFCLTLYLLHAWHMQEVALKLFVKANGQARDFTASAILRYCEISQATPLAVYLPGQEQK